jgi:hypothetical protein
MKKILLLILATVLLSSCLYTNVKFPLDKDVWETKLGTKVECLQTIRFYG